MTATLQLEPTYTAPLDPPDRLGKPGLLSGQSWSELVYCLINFVCAIALFVITVTLITVGGSLALIWFGLPVLVLGLLIARSGGTLYRALAYALLNTSIAVPARLAVQRRTPTSLGKAMLTDPSAWRGVAFHLLNMVLAPIQFSFVIAFYAYGLGAITYWSWREYLPAQLGSDGQLHRGAQLTPDLYIDTWPRILAMAVVGVGVLWLAPRVVRFFTNIDRALMQTLLGPVQPAQ